MNSNPDAYLFDNLVAAPVDDGTVTASLFHTQSTEVLGGAQDGNAGASDNQGVLLQDVPMIFEEADASRAISTSTTGVSHSSVSRRGSVSTIDSYFDNSSGEVPSWLGRKRGDRSSTEGDHKVDRYVSISPFPLLILSRLARNRESAQKCRWKKKKMHEFMIHEIEQLKREKEGLEQELIALQQELNYYVQFHPYYAPSTSAAAHVAPVAAAQDFVVAGPSCPRPGMYEQAPPPVQPAGATWAQHHVDPHAPFPYPPDYTHRLYHPHVARPLFVDETLAIASTYASRPV